MKPLASSVTLLAVAAGWFVYQGMREREAQGEALARDLEATRQELATLRRVVARQLPTRHGSEESRNDWNEARLPVGQNDDPEAFQDELSEEGEAHDEAQARAAYEATIALVNKHFEAEPRERKWASTTEAQIDEALGSLEGASNLVTECRSTLCTAEFDSLLPVGPETMPPLPFDAETVTTTEAQPDGILRVKLFIARAGYPLVPSS